MSRCGRGSLVFWLLTMLTAGASLCARDVGALDLERSRFAGRLGDSADWFLEEDARPAASDPDSGPFVRRITPKSVFVAPSFSGCSEGYRQDGMGRCVKFVKVNQAAQLDFILQKLNSKFAPVNNKNKEKDDSGPFHVNIPLGFGSTRPKDDAQGVSATDRPSPQREEDNVKTESTSTATDRITTAINEENATADSADDGLSLVHGSASVQPASIPSGNESEHRPKPENTVKRQPDGIRPFVIVVSDDFGRPTNTTTTTEAYRYSVDYDKELNTDALPKTTSTDVTTPNTVDVITTDSDGPDSDKASTASDGEEATESVTPFYDTVYTTSPSETDGRPTAVGTDAEFLGAPTQTESEPSATDFDVDADAPTSTASTATTFLDQKTESVPSPDEEEPIGFGSYGDRIIDDNRFGSKRVPNPIQQVQDPYAFSSSLPQENVRVTANCGDTPPSSETLQLGFGRIINANSADVGCPPAPTTPAYPVGTTVSRPYRIRFPGDDIVAGAPYPYAGVSPQNGYKKTGFVRFPERPSVSHGSKVWGDSDVSSSSSTSSGPWYSPPSSSWFPLFQSHKHWMDRYNEYVPVSTVYRKQYHDYRPSASSSSSSSLVLPSWPINVVEKRRGPWLRKDRTLSAPE